MMTRLILFKYKLASLIETRTARTVVRYRIPLLLYRILVHKYLVHKKSKGSDG